MYCRQHRCAIYLFVVYSCFWSVRNVVNASKQHGVPSLGRRDLKMGKKGKTHKKEQIYDDYYYDDTMTHNTTAAPSDTLAPTPVIKSKKKKGKKGKKSKKKKKKNKSKKGLESLSPSPSSGNVTTVAPMLLATAPPIATTAPVATMAPVAASLPTITPGNGTTTTLSPTVKSKSKKKNKKSKKGGKGKGASEVPFELTGSMITQAPIAPAPVPTKVRSKTAAYKAAGSSDTPTSKAPSVNTTPKIPSANHVLAIPTTPSAKNVSTTPKAPLKINMEIATATPSPSLSPSPSPFLSQMTLENEESSASPGPSLLLETVDVSPFQLTYKIVTKDKLSAEQISEAVDISFTFLNDYLMDSFDVNNRIKYDSLLGTRIAHSVDYTTVQYMAAARFVIPAGDSTTYLPATSDIDALIAMAFNPASVETVLDMLRTLPASNPYSTTTAVDYASITVENPSIVPIDPPPQMENGTSVAAKVGISGAVLLICVFTGLVALNRWGYFKKFQRKRNKSSYRKTSTSASRSYSVRKDAIRNVNDIYSADNENYEDYNSVSDCTSSVRSCPPSSSCNTNTINGDDSYRRRILEEDVEIKFLYPASDGNMDCDVSIDDPLFPSSPLISQESDPGKKRHNI